MRPALSSSPEKRRRLLLGLIVAAVAFAALAAGLRARARQDAVVRADPEAVMADPALRRIAIENGRPVYRRSCAACHGAEGRGDQAAGVPDLADDDHLYGEGKAAEIEAIVRYGIRAFDKRGWNLASMPAYASAHPYKAEPLPPQSPAQIEALTQFLLGFAARSTDAAAARRGRIAYDAAGCWDCHDHDLGGDPSIGAPALTDDIWLYGGSHDAIYRTIAYGRAGASPAFGGTLTPAEIRNVAVYAASLASGTRR